MGIKEDPGLFKELGILIDPEVANKLLTSTLQFHHHHNHSHDLHHHNRNVQVGEGRIGDCLLQIFSTPLFAENTFFLEVETMTKSSKFQIQLRVQVPNPIQCQVIQRRGLCRGFGAGNILALALSIVMMQREREQKDSEKNVELKES